MKTPRVPVPNSIRPIFEKIPVVRAAQSAMLLRGRDLISYLRFAVTRAHTSITIVQFVIDIRPTVDVTGAIRYLLNDIAMASRRGVRVTIVLPRVLTVGYASEIDANELAKKYLMARGIGVFEYRGTSQRPYLHAKCVVIDDNVVVVGNANWTPAAVVENQEVSLAIRSSNNAVFANQRIQAAALLSNFLPPTTYTAPADYTRRLSEEYGGNIDLAMFDDALLGIVRAPPVPLGISDSISEKSDADESLHASGMELFDALNRPSRYPLYSRLLGGQTYLGDIAGAIQRATTRIWIAMSILRTTRSRALAPLLFQLSTARQRGVDIRILCDGMSTQAEMSLEDRRTLSDRGFAVRTYARGKLGLRLV